MLESGLHPLTPGRGMVIFPYQGHHYAQFEDHEITWLYLTFELLEWQPLAALRNRTFALNDILMGRACDLVAAFEDWRAGTERAGEDVVARACLVLNAALDAPVVGNNAPAIGRASSGSRQDLVHRLVTHIYQNLDTPLSIDQLAQAFGMSPSHIRRVFRNTVNTSLGTFVRRARVNRACGMLHQTSLSVTEVGEACGFASLYAFSRAFKRHTGVSPLQFRAGLGRE